MAHYRLYFLNEGGSIWRAVDLDCADDAAAMHEAGKHLSEWSLELWQGARMVGRLTAGEAEPD